MSVKHLVLACMFSCFHESYAQRSVSATKSDRVFLNEVIVTASKLKDSEIGLNCIEIDSALLQQTGGYSFSELFRYIAAGQMRSYGNNGLSTPSFRGTGGSHTAILWNGINLQSPLSGQVDLSLIPVAFVDNLSFQKGGGGSLYGSGAIGGSVQLDNQIRFNRELSFSTHQEIGSFSNYYQQYQVAFGNTSFENSTQIFRRVLENDFPYKNRYERPVTVRTRKNAGALQYGILQQNNFRLNSSHIMGVKFWYQDNNVKVPESILADEYSESIQRDEFIRGLFFWNYDKSRVSVAYKQAYNWHQLYFLTYPPMQIHTVHSIHGLTA